MSNPPDVIETYLDSVCRHLQVIPEEDLAEIRSELREHLLSSVDAIMADDVDPHDAEAEAVRRFGPASRIGNRILATFPYAWTWDWEGYSIRSVPSAPVALRIYCFWGAVIVCAIGSFAPLLSTATTLFGVAAFGAAFESYRYIRDSFEIEAKARLHRGGNVEKRVETAVRPSGLYRRLGLDKLPTTMRTCLPQELPSLMSSNIVTVLLGSVIADIDYYSHDHHNTHRLATGMGVSLLFYAYALGAIACRVFLRYAAKRPGLLFTFKEYADVEVA